MIKKFENKKLENEEIENKEIQKEKKQYLENLWEWFYKFIVWINFWWIDFERWKTYKLDENLIERFKTNKIL